MKEYNFKQVRKALENKGFAPSGGFSNNTEHTTIFEKSSGTQHGLEFVNVEEWIEDGTCTINGKNPVNWYNEYFIA